MNTNQEDVATRILELEEQAQAQGGLSDAEREEYERLTSQ